MITTTEWRPPYGTMAMYACRVAQRKRAYMRLFGAISRKHFVMIAAHRLRLLTWNHPFVNDELRFMGLWIYVCTLSCTGIVFRLGCVPREHIFANGHYCGHGIEMRGAPPYYRNVRFVWCFVHMMRFGVHLYDVLQYLYL